MAEFVRIWDEVAQEYVEYDTTVKETTTTSVPVAPVSISRDIKTGIVQKTIDTNSITVGTQTIDISQIFKPITVEKSDANRLSIQTSTANMIDVNASRSEIVITKSDIGQRGLKGDKGDDSILAFDSRAQYIGGDFVQFGGLTFVVRQPLDGRVTRLVDPVEGDLWSQIVDRSFIDNLPFTNGHEIKTQADWDILESTIALGDLVNVSSETDTLELALFNETQPYEIINADGPIVNAAGNQYTVVEATAGSIIVEGVGAHDVTVADFESALTLSNVTFGNDAVLNTNTFISTSNELGVSTGFQILSVVQERTFPTNAVRVGISGPGVSSASVATGFILFSSNRIGVEIGQNVTELVVGDQLYIQGELSTTLRTIMGIARFGTSTFYNIGNFEGFDVGDFTIGRINTTQILDKGQWYVRNSNVASFEAKLDPLATDDVLRTTVEGLVANTPTISTNPGLIAGSTRSRADTFFAGSDENQPRPFRLNSEYVLQYLLLKSDGGRFNTTNFPNTNQAQDLWFNAANGFNFAPTEQGAQQNYIDDVDETGNSPLSTTISTETIDIGGGQSVNREIRTLSSNAERNVVQTATGNLNIDSVTRVISTNAEQNLVDGVEAGSLLSLDPSTKLLSTGAEVNVVDTVTSNTGLNKFEFVVGDRELFIPELDIAIVGGVDQQGKIIKLDVNGLIPADAIGKINLSNVRVFELIESRNLTTTATSLWVLGDIAIVAGVPNLEVATTLVEGETSLILSDTSQLYVPGTGETSRVFLAQGGNFKEFLYTANDTVTNTLTIIGSITADDVTDFPVGSRATIQTGTFVYSSSAGDQTVAGATTDSDWAELVPTTGVVSSINNQAGVVTLSASNIPSLDGTVVENVQTALNSIRSTAEALSIEVGDPSVEGVTDATGLTKIVEDNKTQIDINTPLAASAIQAKSFTTATETTGKVAVEFNAGELQDFTLSINNTLTLNGFSQLAYSDGSVEIFEAFGSHLRGASNGNKTPWIDKDNEVQADNIRPTRGNPLYSETFVGIAPGTNEEIVEDLEIILPVFWASLARPYIITNRSGNQLTISKGLDRPFGAISFVVGDGRWVTSFGDVNSVSGVEGLADISSKQDNLTAGEGIDITNNNISVSRAAGFQVTVFMFGKGTTDSEYNLTDDGNTVTMVQFTDGDEIEDIIELETKGWILVDGIDSEIYNIAGTCSLPDANGNIITNAQACQNITGTWTLDIGPARLERIT